ncbi:hypothetical protein ACBY01_08685 [Sphingomonas sp. ac-8]|uniref:hypothetical protein n=1 Tax=Sphingomonas sp. ac-8 TaxID=3242977 RepID=UPI003A8103E2
MEAKAEFTVEDALNRLEPNLPGPVRHRLRNSLNNFYRAAHLFDLDREMSSFRAITGEEEAASALMKAVHLRGYEHSRELNPRDHVHKAAVMACVGAIASTMKPMLGEFQLIFDFDKRRVDVKVPLTAFNVSGGDSYAIQPVEPLGLTFTRPGVDRQNLYDDVLKQIAGIGSFDSIKKMVSATANERNRLLYASDATTPRSFATTRSIRNRKLRAQTMLVLAIMVLQSRDQLPLVREAILAFLGIISRLPQEHRADG